MMNKYITTYGENGYFNLQNLAVDVNVWFKAKFMPLDSPNGFIFGDFNNPYLAIFHPDASNAWPSSTFRWYINGSEGLAYEAASLADIIGNEFVIELHSDYMYVNNILQNGKSFPNRTYTNFGIGYGFSPTFDFQKPIRWEYFQVWYAQTLVYDLVPAYNDGKYCFYDNVSGNYIYAVGNVDGSASSIIASAQKTTLASTGETINISVDCPNAWTVTGNTFITLSATGDTGSTTITATAPSYSGATARTDTLTFSDSVTGDEVVVTLKQKKYSSGQPLYLGVDEISEIYLGDHQISEAYLGEHLVYTSGPFTGIKLTPSTLKFNPITLERTLNVKSSEAWTITTPSWISASPTSGDTGKTVVTLTASAQTAATSGTIEVVSTNYSATTQVGFDVVEQVDYIHAQTMSDNSQLHITLPVNSTPDSRVRITGKGAGYSTGWIIVGNGLSDVNGDWRWFGISKEIYFDINKNRLNQGNLSYTPFGSDGLGRNFDFLLSDHYWVAEYNGNTYTATGVPQPNVSPRPFILALAVLWISAIEIYDYETLVFDGIAAKMGDEYGIYDKVSGNFITSSDFTIVGENDN